MKRKHVILATVFSLLASQLQAQDNSSVADTLQQSGKIYAVIAVVLVILAGLFIFLFRIENKVKKMEEELKK